MVFLPAGTSSVMWLGGREGGNGGRGHNRLPPTGSTHDLWETTTSPKELWRWGLFPLHTCLFAITPFWPLLISDTRTYAPKGQTTHLKLPEWFPDTPFTCTFGSGERMRAEWNTSALWILSTGILITTFFTNIIIVFFLLLPSHTLSRWVRGKQ